MTVVETGVQGCRGPRNEFVERDRVSQPTRYFCLHEWGLQGRVSDCGPCVIRDLGPDDLLDSRSQFRVSWLSPYPHGPPKSPVTLEN